MQTLKYGNEIGNTCSHLYSKLGTVWKIQCNMIYPPSLHEVATHLQYHMKRFRFKLQIPHLLTGHTKVLDFDNIWVSNFQPLYHSTLMCCVWSACLLWEFGDSHLLAGPLGL